MLAPLSLSPLPLVRTTMRSQLSPPTRTAPLAPFVYVLGRLGDLRAVPLSVPNPAHACAGAMSGQANLLLMKQLKGARCALHCPPHAARQQPGRARPPLCSQT